MGQCASELATERPKRRVAAPSLAGRRGRRLRLQLDLLVRNVDARHDADEPLTLELVAATVDGPGGASADPDPALYVDEALDQSHNSRDIVLADPGVAAEGLEVQSDAAMPPYDAADHPSLNPLAPLHDGASSEVDPRSDREEAAASPSLMTGEGEQHKELTALQRIDRRSSAASEECDWSILAREGGRFSCSERASSGRRSSAGDVITYPYSIDGSSSAAALLTVDAVATLPSTCHRDARFLVTGRWVSECSSATSL